VIYSELIVDPSLTHDDDVVIIVASLLWGLLMCSEIQ